MRVIIGGGDTTHTHSQDIFWCHSSDSNVIMTICAQCQWSLPICDKFCLFATTSDHWQWFLLNDGNYMHLMPITLLQKSQWLSLHSSTSKPGDLSLSPMQPPFPCPFLFDILYSYPRSLLRSSPTHYLAHCLSIARYSLMYVICITYAHFPSSHYTSIYIVIILQVITPVLPMV
jgi:hypothetical protein